MVTPEASYRPMPSALLPSAATIPVLLVPIKLPLIARLVTLSPEEPPTSMPKPSKRSIINPLTVELSDVVSKYNPLAFAPAPVPLSSIFNTAFEPMPKLF